MREPTRRILLYVTKLLMITWFVFSYVAICYPSKTWFMEKKVLFVFAVICAATYIYFEHKSVGTVVANRSQRKKDGVVLDKKIKLSKMEILNIVTLFIAVELLSYKALSIYGKPLMHQVLLVSFVVGILSILISYDLIKSAML